MPAVFVHGVPDTAVMWEPLLAALARTDVVTLGSPGLRERAGARAGSATKEEYAGWLGDQLAAIGEPVDLVAHDWGAMLAQRVASVQPDLVRTLAVGSGPLDRTYAWHPMAQAWQTPDIGEQIMEGMLALPVADLAAGLAAGGAPPDLSARPGRAPGPADGGMHPRAVPVGRHGRCRVAGRGRRDAASTRGRVPRRRRPVPRCDRRRAAGGASRGEARRVPRLQPLVAMGRAPRRRRSR